MNYKERRMRKMLALELKVRVYRVTVKYVENDEVRVCEVYYDTRPAIKELKAVFPNIYDVQVKKVDAMLTVSGSYFKENSYELERE